MAEDGHYASGDKRKYEDQTTPSPVSSGGRSGTRTTGFSAPIVAQSPSDAPPSYNNVPPPPSSAIDEIQLAKQRAQEIAARLFSNAEVKRPRIENGFDSMDNKGFSSAPTDLGQKPLASNVSAFMTGSYGFAGRSKKIEIPNERVGVVIGKSGETIKYLQLQSGAKIQVTRDIDADRGAPTRGVELVGDPEQIAKAEQLIKDVLAEAESGGSGVVSRRVTGQQGGAEQFVMQVPNNKVGLVIGKGGETIKNMQAMSGARIQVIPLHLPPGDASNERTVQIDGSGEQIEAAKKLVYEVISENRLRNPAGGYSQQGYQARPPTNWAPPGAPMQQPAYGYVQPGAYPGPSPQYNMNQQPYSGYPQQTSGGYATGWDQTTPPPNQQTTQGGSYDYYNQQQPVQQQQAPGGTTAPTDNTAYGYNQPPASGYGQQGYAQDGYGGYHAPHPQAGYGQPNAIPGYDQQQQGYNSTPGGYGNVSNPTPDGQTPSYGTQGDTNQAAPPVQASAMGQQGYNSGQQPSPNSSYPSHQGSTQPGYGMPPTTQSGYGTQPPAGYGPSYGPPQTQKTPAGQPAYGQPQQSPSAQGGYSQPAAVQPGYTHSQPPPAQSGYAQPDSGTQRALPSTYGTPTAQPGAYPPQYGAPLSSQPSYGQQQPPYNSSYGAGYAQPPAYAGAADGIASGSSRGTYDAAPPSQSGQPGGAAKLSPQA